MKVTILPSGQTTEVEQGTPLSDALKTLFPDTDFPCGGRGRCGACRCVVRSPGNPPIEVLACQMAVLNDTEVLARFPLRTQDVHITIRKRVHYHPTRHYAVAVDVGTTTLAAAIVEVESGEDIVVVEATNPQVAFGADIMTRISYCQERSDGLDILRTSLVRKLDTLLLRASEEAGVDRVRIERMVIAGNTFMEHIVCGVSPAGLAMSPYKPSFVAPKALDAHEVGLTSFPSVPVFTAPIIGGFVGGDVAAGLLALDIDTCEEATVFMDVGTNGEIVVSYDGTTRGASTAAGPAFEGVGISCGQRAHSGAIASVRLTDPVSIKTIKDGEVPTGLCGSGILSVVAQLVRVGIVEPSGRLRPLAQWPSHIPSGLRTCYEEKDGEQRVYLCDGVFVSQRDIRQIQLAKSALRTGLDVVLGSFGITPDMVERIFIGGAFGLHLDVDDAIAVGMLPAAFKGKVIQCGNTSLIGARILATEPALIEHLAQRCGSIDILNLAELPTFKDIFVENLLLISR